MPESTVAILQFPGTNCEYETLRAVRRAGTVGESRDLTVRVHPEVALHLLEQEPDFLRSLREESGIDLDIRDDPLMRQDEYRLLAAPASTDVTAKYAVA